MSSSVIDYFAVLGRGDGPLQSDPFKNIWSEGKATLTAVQVLDEAITDILVLNADQSPPDDTWALLVTTAEDNQVDPPYLAIRRFADSKRLDYITDVKIAMPNEVIPDGYEAVQGFHLGSDAVSLLGRGLLIIKRANATDLRYWKADPIIEDIAFVKKSAGEELPEKYLEIEVLPTAQQYLHLQSRNAADVSIVLHRRPGLGLCDLVYQSATTDRYPRTDHDKLELPVTGLPMFAFPHGLHLTLTDAGQFPLPLFFTFVFTDADGKHFYVACLQFYEQVVEADLQDAFRAVHGEDKEIRIPEDKRIFCPKVICAVSQWPFYRAMRRFLRQLYSLSFSTLRCPLEYYVASVVHQVPFPLEGGRPFHVTLDVALISHTSKAMAPIEFNLPSPYGFPLMDVDFAGPLRCLSVEHLLAVFALMLREAKLLFVCESNTMLTEVMETLRALLFPLSWASCFVPRLPVALTGLLQAPGGFMIGIHIPSEIGATTQAFLRDLHSCRSLVQGTYVIDLTANTIAQYTGRSFDRLDAPRVETLLKTLPFGPKFRLQNTLKKLCVEYSIGPQAVNLSEFDSAFELQSAEGLANAEKWESFPTLLVRDAFFAFLIDFLGDYSKYIIPPSEDLDADTYRTFQEEFAISQYLEFADKASRTASELLLETQMFSALVQRRAEGRQPGLVFFEHAGSLMRELSLSAGGHGWNNLPNRPAGEVLELPLPIYGLVMADVQWAGLGATRQQQLRASTSIHPADSAAATSTATGAPALSGRHHLTYLTTGTMNVLRSGAIPLPYNYTQPVFIQRLDDLMTMWEFLNVSHVGREKSHTFGEIETSDVQRAREEINLPLPELHLDNPAFGPLIIPGPSRAYSSGEEDGAAAGVKTFSYHTGWPALSVEYTDQALKSAINPGVPAIRAFRKNFGGQVGKDVLLLVRPPAQRLAFEQHGKLINPVRLPVSEEVGAVVSMLADLAAISLTLLAARTMHPCKPASDVLLMLGVVAQLDHWELLPTMSESTWRALLVGCANAGGDLMRRVCCIVYQLMPHITGQTPDSLSYGCYLRALAAKKRHMGSLEPVILGKAHKSAPTLFSTPDASEAMVDPYLYLEEMGTTWYIQRSALQGQSLALPVLPASAGNQRSNPVSPLSTVTGAVSKTLNITKRFPVALSFRSAENSPGDIGGDKRPISIKPEATKLTAGQFSLADGPGMLRFHRPIALLSLCPPRKVSEFTVSDKAPQPAALSAELLLRMDQLYAGALPHIRRMSTQFMQSLQDARVRSDSRPPTAPAAPAATTTASSSSSTEVSPVNPNSSTGRIAALSRRFFTSGNKKSEPSSPVPASAVPTQGSDHVELTSGSNSNAATVQQHSAPAPQTAQPAPVSPNPFGWAKKLRPAMFFGGSPSTPVTPSTSKPAEQADVELKVLSATLNFDDEDSGGEDNGSNEGEGERSSGKGPAWAALPEGADGIASLTPPEPNLLDAIDEQGESQVTSPTTESQAAELTETAGDATAAQPGPSQDAAGSVGEAGQPADTTDTLLDLDCEAAEVVADEHQLFASDAKSETADSAALSTIAEESTPIPTTTAAPEPEPAKAAKAVDVVALQAHLLTAFEQEFVAQGKVLGIYSATPCAHCGFTMLDEEILTRWCHGNGYETHIKGNTRSPHARDMYEVHKVTCKQCAEEITPQLHVSCYATATPHSSAASSNGHSTPHSPSSSAVDLACLWTEHVSYLSPFGLRFELEALLMQHGHAAISTSWLQEHHPAVLWGILFYSTRVHLPSGLHHTRRDGSDAATVGGSFLHPVVVAWRECTVKALAQRVLTGKAYDFLTVRDVFPQCSDEDVQRLESEVVPALDGSPASMRVAMLAFSECATVRAYGQQVGFTPARLLNLGLLIMCYLYNQTHFTEPSKFNQLAHLEKEPRFERIFVDTIKCVLSPNDLQRIGASETELLASCASRSVVIVRNALGFLY